MNVLFSAPDDEWDNYGDLLPRAFAAAGIEAEITHSMAPEAPERFDYIIYAPSSEMKDFAPFTNVKAVMNLWAGVESIVGNDTLTQPLARMVDPGLTEGMVEWCLGHVMRHHLGFDRDVCRRDAVWDYYVPNLARERKVTVLGLGELGQAVSETLSGLNFQLRGWSRSAKEIAGVDCHSGEAGLAEALAGAEIVVLLLPLTAATEDLMNAERIALLAPGAVVINPGRGPLIDDDALIAALDSGHLSHATLDVFREEPLPESHPFWAHEKVTVTPHVASATRAVTAVGVIAENIRRGEAGEDFLHLVDRSLGY
ncbi:MAG: glyoxylate/hydroxypyruvate reductase A [Silicimonas sp.]|nr:glyoxylate/hydroxypyruvate reductase A [Silicimonas sp.]